MSLLKILEYPDPRLKKIAIPIAIENINSDSTKKIINDMFETMYYAKGVGLAAIQVNIDLQIITVDISEDHNQPLCIINPKILYAREPIISNEGCLSFPGISVRVTRNKFIGIEFFDMDANKQTLQAENLLSICLQHEMDHLNGKTFFDYLSPLKRSILDRKIKKLKNIK